MPRMMVSIACALALGLAACSGAPQDTASSRTNASSPTMTTPSASASSEPATPSPSNTQSQTGGTGSTSTPTVADGPAPSGTPIPPAGTYQFAQSGTEKFCSQATCGTPRPLPATMTAIVTRTASDAARLELRIASGRTVRASLAFASSGIRVRELSAEITESGITQSATVRPVPPVLLVSTPLRAGARWSGTYQDEDSTGTYAFRAIRQEQIRAAGKQRNAWKIDGSITLEGETTGSLILTLWLDPRTNQILRINATIDVTSTLTRYVAEFQDTVESGPSL